MLFKNITILNEKYEIEKERYVLVKGDKIAYIGDKAPEDSFSRAYDGKGKLLMSAFFNAHAHSPMTLLRGYGENMGLQDWLFNKIFPFEDQLDGNAVYWGTMLAMAESLKYGIVSSSDMYYFCDDMARAVIESGAKANISRSITNPMGADPETLVSMQEMKDFYNDFHGVADGRVKVDMSLHAEYTSNRETACALAEYTKTIGDTIMHVHLSETELEHKECIERHGMTPAAYMADTGLFDVPSIAAHCVYCTDEDLDILKTKGVTVASNPASNMKLASGVCNVSKVLEKGINLALGTDSVASNNSLNMVEEMKLMAIGCKVYYKDPTLVMPVDALRAATVGGAIAQGRNDSGVLKVGNKADLIVMDISGPNMYPVHNFINNLVYSSSGSDVVMTMSDGKVLYENGVYTTIDIEKTIYNVETATQKILERL